MRSPIFGLPLIGLIGLIPALVLPLIKWLRNF